MRQRALIVTGGIFHPFDETSQVLAATLTSLDIDSVITSDLEAGFESLSDFDLLVVNALRWRMQGEKYDRQREEWSFRLSEAGRVAILDHLASGGGLLGLHTASICFDDWEDWSQVLGGCWAWGRSHHPPQSEFTVCIADDRHPIVSGLRDFQVTDEVYSDLDLSPDCRPILRSGKDSGEQPLLWAHSHSAGRVVYDALGHDGASLAEPTHKRIIERAALWALRRPDAEVEAR